MHSAELFGKSLSSCQVIQMFFITLMMNCFFALLHFCCFMKMEAFVCFSMVCRVGLRDGNIIITSIETGVTTCILLESSVKFEIKKIRRINFKDKQQNNIMMNMYYDVLQCYYIRSFYPPFPQMLQSIGHDL